MATEAGAPLGREALPTASPRGIGEGSQHRASLARDRRRAGLGPSGRAAPVVCCALFPGSVGFLPQPALSGRGGHREPPATTGGVSAASRHRVGRAQAHRPDGDIAGERGERPVERGESPGDRRVERGESPAMGIELRETVRRGAGLRLRWSMRGRRSARSSHHIGRDTRGALGRGRPHSLLSQPALATLPSTAMHRLSAPLDSDQAAMMLPSAYFPSWWRWEEYGKPMIRCSHMCSHPVLPSASLPPSHQDSNTAHCKPKRVVAKSPKLEMYSSISSKRVPAATRISFKVVRLPQGRFRRF